MNGDKPYLIIFLGKPSIKTKAKKEISRYVEVQLPNI
jgi:hypothetical protein